VVESGLVWIWCGVDLVWVVCPSVVFARGVMQVWQPQKPNFNLHACEHLKHLRLVEGPGPEPFGI